MSHNSITGLITLMQIVYLIVYVSTSRDQGTGQIWFPILFVKHNAWDMVESQ